MTSRHFNSPALLLAIVWPAFCWLSLAHAPIAFAVDFQTEIRPILSEKCFHCHGPDAATRQADLRLDLAESAREVLSTDADPTSELLRRITSHSPDEQMPPPDSIKQLSSAELSSLKQWIAEGANYETHWAFQRPQRPILPNTHADAHAEAWCSNPIDAFVLAEMQKHDLSPAQPATPATLLRRICLDLVGLPPSMAMTQQFDRHVDKGGLPLAIPALVDQLMASAAYAEHMALPWLEAARYADTDGYQNDRYRYQFPWRDWVLRALNEKMPYDQFVIEQMAGDMLPNATLWQQVASGFGRNHRINSEDGSISEEWRTENVVDRVDTFGTVFLGLTIGCARCHDHKYDPISQREYYELFAYFNSIAEHGVGPNNGNSPPFIELPKSWPLIDTTEDHALTPEPVQLRSARKESGNGLQRPQAGEPGTVMVMHELETPRETFVLLRGQYNQPDPTQPLSPSVPAALTSLGSSNEHARASTPKNRLELAQWLVDGRNPLTSRVAVNRLWQQFFGVGLVESSENFGSQGALPSHRPLLDWLATELEDSDWDLQHIQRLIIGSSTYQQSSVLSPETIAADPKNRWLARGPRLRLPGFVLRDQALAASGLLVHRTGGPSAKPYMPPKIWASISNNKYEQDQGENLFRRSVYTYWRRTIPPPTMMNFNAAAREVCTVRTEQTNTPLQALTLLNNKTFVEASRALAEKMLQIPEPPATQITWGFSIVTARQPSPRERDLLLSTYTRMHGEFTDHVESANQLLSIGDSPRDTTLPEAQHAAMTMTASMILNLDEAITKE